MEIKDVIVDREIKLISSFTIQAGNVVRIEQTKIPGTAHRKPLVPNIIWRIKVPKETSFREATSFEIALLEDLWNKYQKTLPVFPEYKEETLVVEVSSNSHLTEYG
jgi:hypothetical protein